MEWWLEVGVLEKAVDLLSRALALMVRDQVFRNSADRLGPSCVVGAVLRRDLRPNVGLSISPGKTESLRIVGSTRKGAWGYLSISPPCRAEMEQRTGGHCGHHKFQGVSLGKPR